MLFYKKIPYFADERGNEVELLGSVLHAAFHLHALKLGVIFGFDSTESEFFFASYLIRHEANKRMHKEWFAANNC